MIIDRANGKSLKKRYSKTVEQQITVVLKNQFSQSLETLKIVGKESICIP